LMRTLHDRMILVCAITIKVIHFRQRRLVGSAGEYALGKWRAVQILRNLGTACLIQQPKYSMFNRWIEGGLLKVLEEEGLGCIAFSPLAQGILTDRYLSGIPDDSRAAKPHGFLQREEVTREKLDKVRKLSEIAKARSQSLAQMAVAWVLRHPGMTSALIGASRVVQIEELVGALGSLHFTGSELKALEEVLSA